MTIDREFSAVQNTCKSKPEHPDVVSNVNVIKVPVVLAEIGVQTSLVATFRFPDPVLEIKNVKKQLMLTQCRLLLPSNQLYIKGFVRKNIQYTTPIAPVTGSSSIHSVLRSFTTNVPFRCVTKVEKLLTQPEWPQYTSRQEFNFHFKTNMQEFKQNDPLASNHFTHSHDFNDIPYCVLVANKISEWDEALDHQSMSDGPFHEGTFTCVEEKMLLQFRIQIIQNQQINPVKDSATLRPLPLREEPIEAPVEKSVEEPVGESFEEETLSHPADEMVENPDTDSYGESSGESLEDSFEASFERYFKRPFKEPFRNPYKNYLEESIEESFGRFFKRPLTEAYKETIKESTIEFSKDSSKVLFDDDSLEDSVDEWVDGSSEDSKRDPLKDSGRESFDDDLLEESFDSLFEESKDE